MRSLDLFSCVGCHAIGFERAGIETAALCEIEPWRRERLKEKWPEIKIYEDVQSIHNPPAVDIVFGGPPCQRTSVAAAIHGKRSNHSLFPYMLAVGLDAKAEWIVVEQPPGNAEWTRSVQDDLAAAGYHVGEVEFGACDVGAPYLRWRHYTLACTSLPRLEIAWQAVPSAIDTVKRSADARTAWCPDILATLPVVAVDAGEMDRGPKSRERKEWILALGDSNPPRWLRSLGGLLCKLNNI